MDITPTIEVYFKIENDEEKYTTYDVEDNDETLQLSPFIFPNIVNYNDRDDDEVNLIPVEILQHRYKNMQKQVLFINACVKLKIENMIKYQNI